MKNVKYDLCNWDESPMTLCKFLQKKRIFKRVGSDDCIECQNFSSIDRKKQIVKCKEKEKP